MSWLVTAPNCYSIVVATPFSLKTNLSRGVRRNMHPATPRVSSESPSSQLKKTSEVSLPRPFGLEEPPPSPHLTHTCDIEESNPSLRHERVQSESGKGKTRGTMSGQNVKFTGKQVPYGFNIGRSLPFCGKTAAI